MKGVYLKIKSAAVALPTGLSITAENPAFSSEYTGKAYSFPLKLEWNTDTKALFKHAYRLDAFVKIEALPVHIYHHGLPITRGFIKTGENNQSNNETFECHFKNTDTDIFAKLNDFKISEVLPKIDVPQVDPSKLIVRLNSTSAVPGTTYRLILGKEYFYVANSNQQIEVIAALKDAINADFPGTAQTINVPNYTELHITLTETYSPNVLVESTSGLVILYYKTWTQATHDNFIAFLKTALITPREDVAFPWIVNENFYETKNPAYFFPWINRCYYENNNWVIPLNLPSDEEYFERTFQPFYRIKYVLKKICDRIGALGIKNDENWWQDFEKILMDNNYALDNVRKDYVYETVNNNVLNVYKFLNCYTRQIDPANHLNDITAKQFLTDICSTFNLNYSYEAGYIVLKRSNMVFDAPPQYWNDVILNTTQRSFKDDKGYRLTYKKDDNEQLPALPSRDKGEASERIELPISTMVASDSSGLVKTQRYGSTTAFGIGKKPFAMRFFFDKGFQNGIYKSSITGDYFSFDLNHPTISFYKVFWEGTAELRSKAFSVELTRSIPPYQLMQLLTFRKSKIYLNTPDGSVRIFIKTIETKLIDEKNVKVKFTLLVG
jgi:hypothetical protein